MAACYNHRHFKDISLAHKLQMCVTEVGSRGSLAAFIVRLGRGGAKETTQMALSSADVRGWRALAQSWEATFWSRGKPGREDHGTWTWGRWRGVGKVRNKVGVK